MKLWSLVHDQSLMACYQSLPGRILEKERWFADRGSGTTLELSVTFQYQSLLDKTVYLTINLFSLPQIPTQYYYYLPLLITAQALPDRPLFFSQAQLYFYDGVPTPEYLSWVEQMWEHPQPASPSGEGGRLVFTATQGMYRRVFTALGSSSNSLLLVSQSCLLKNYRRVFPGQNPELRLGRALTQLGSEYIPELRGSFSYHGAADNEYTLGLVQEKLEHQGTGWEIWARLVAAGTAEQRAELLDQAYRLGQNLAGLHCELAAVARAQNRWTVYTGALLQERAVQLGDLIQAELAADQPELARAAGQSLSRTIALINPETNLGLAFRIHGDLHLEQVLKTGNNWKVIDFEGEPLKTIAEREYYDSPLKDLASLLRSVSYRIKTLAMDEASDWETRLQRELVAGYREAYRELREGFLPESPLFEQMISLFQLERVIYELIYESKYRPDWVAIPLAGLRRLALESGLNEEEELE